MHSAESNGFSARLPGLPGLPAPPALSNGSSHIAPKVVANCSVDWFKQAPKASLKDGAGALNNPTFSVWLTGRCSRTGVWGSIDGNKLHDRRMWVDVRIGAGCRFGRQVCTVVGCVRWPTMRPPCMLVGCVQWSAIWPPNRQDLKRREMVGG